MRLDRYEEQGHLQYCRSFAAPKNLIWHGLGANEVKLGLLKYDQIFLLLRLKWQHSEPFKDF